MNWKQESEKKRKGNVGHNLFGLMSGKGTIKTISK